MKQTLQDGRATFVFLLPRGYLEFGALEDPFNKNSIRANSRNPRLALTLIINLSLVVPIPRTFVRVLIFRKISSSTIIEP